MKKPTTPQDWQLYLGLPATHYAAVALTQALDRIIALPIGTSDELLLAAWKQFQTAQYRYRKEGANDTEPRHVALSYLDTLLGPGRVSKVLG